MTQANTQVLIVDDIEDNVKALSYDLDDYGFSILTASNGQQAIDSCQQHLPDIILLDVIMPDMTGFEVCQQLKADPATRHIPIILISAMDRSDSIVRGLDAGAQGYITKPYFYAEVIEKIEMLLS